MLSNYQATSRVLSTGDKRDKVFLELKGRWGESHWTRFALNNAHKHIRCLEWPKGKLQGVTSQYPRSSNSGYKIREVFSERVIVKQTPEGSIGPPQMEGGGLSIPAEVGELWGESVCHPEVLLGNDDQQHLWSAVSDTRQGTCRARSWESQKGLCFWTAHFNHRRSTMTSQQKFDTNAEIPVGSINAKAAHQIPSCEPYFQHGWGSPHLKMLYHFIHFGTLPIWNALSLYPFWNKTSFIHFTLWKTIV